MSSPMSLDRRASLAWLRRFATTTPGVVSVIAVVVAAGCVIAGVVCAAQLDRRIAEHDAVLDRSEPFAHSAQNLYAALSAADAASASGFLSGTETGPIRDQYLQAVADAASALADATASATDEKSRTAVAEITAQLATYTGLVEAARANSRQGFPIGSAYLREASSLMQNTLLPGAQSIFTDDLAEVDSGQRAVGSLPIASLVMLLLGLVAIGAASVILSRRTNRQFNIGLLVAAALVLVVMTWVVVATQFAASAVERSRADGTERFDQLAQARIIAQQARTEETLQLIERGNVTDSDASFDAYVAELTGLLGSEPSAASDGLQKWAASHEKQVQAYQAGDYPGAVEQALGDSPDASAAQFAIVETSLRDEIAQTRTTLRDGVSAAGTWLAWSPTGALLLMVVAAVATVVGLWPRLKEFL